MKFDSANIILLHPGKTGGTSVERTLKDLYLGKSFQLDHRIPNYDIMFGFDTNLRMYLQHLDLFWYHKLNINYTEYKTVCTVRRPYERILSCYYYNGRSEKWTFTEFICEHLEKDLMLSIDKGYCVNHFGPQVYYTNYLDYTVNDIIHLENFRQEAEDIGIKINYHCSQTVKTKIYTNYMDAYNHKMKDIVYSLYKDDFIEYGYDK